MRSVLIVEDERSVREALVKAVTQSGHRAIGAQGLVAAREQLAAEDVGCVLLDVRLRDGDGLSLLSEIRQGERRDIPVIIATAYGDSERTIQAMRDGAFEYLTKPFDLPLLLATVGRAMKQQELTPSAPPASWEPESPERTRLPCDRGDSVHRRDATLHWQDVENQELKPSVSARFLHSPVPRRLSAKPARCWRRKFCVQFRASNRTVSSRSRARRMRAAPTLLVSRRATAATSCAYRTVRVVRDERVQHRGDACQHLLEPELRLGLLHELA